MRVHEDSRKFTGFITEDRFYECLWVPFGLKKVLLHFQRMVDSILGMYRLDFTLAYIDDVVKEIVSNGVKYEMNEDNVFPTWE